MVVSEKYELIASSMRLLTLLFGFKDKTSFQMTFDKLILYDFYLRFPKTMIGETANVEEYDFEELFSFYHSEPDRENYHRLIKFLRSKGLISKVIKDGSFIYQITELGKTTVLKIDSPLSIQLIKNANVIAKKYSKIADSVLKDEIHQRTKSNIKMV